MRSLEMRKNRRLRSVCAPQRWSAGTSIGPKLSFSVRVPAIPALMLRQVEEQNFGVFAAGERERAFVGLQRIACHKALAVYRNGAARHMHVRLAARGKLGASVLRTVEQAGVDARILMDAHRAVVAVRGGDEPQATALFAG